MDVVGPFCNTSALVEKVKYTKINVKNRIQWLIYKEQYDNLNVHCKSPSNIYWNAYITIEA